MSEQRSLIRAVGLPGAVMMGMGSIVGTGVFVSLGLAAGLTGAGMILALFLAGCLAVFNGLSTAQLAAAHPVSGGTYEYGYRYLNPWLGYLAGWLFVCAKSASAATAAIGFGGYFTNLFGLPELEPWTVGLAAATFVIVVAILGIRRSNLTNVLIVSATLLSLAAYVVFLAPEVRMPNFTPAFEAHTGATFGAPLFFEAAALMFVAYTGYGRIATLGEEIRDPIRNIPKAIIITLGLSFALYMAVATVSIGAAGAASFYRATVQQAAPLEVIAETAGRPWVAKLLAVGAMTAMLGVLLNLVLGLSRVIYAMGRKNDLPAAVSRVDRTHHAPYAAILVSGAVILGLILLKDVKATWSFSAFTVLFYYALTNAAALRLPKDKRLYPRILAWFGLFGCVGLSFWVERQALMLGAALLAAGAVWRLVYQRVTR